MTYTVEVQSAHRFRAYAAAKITRKPVAEDHIKREKDGKPPLPKGSKIRYDAEQIAIDGEVSGNAVLIHAGDVTVTRVVFYAGSVDAEVVVGSLEVNASGDIVIDLVEPVATETPAEGKPEIVDE